MKRITIILLLLIIVGKVNAIEKYSKHDTLFAIVDELLLRSEPNFKSKIVDLINLGEIVVSLQVKYNKDGDIALNSSGLGWESMVTGRWVKVKYFGKVGFVFDAYLSHFNFLDFKNESDVVFHDTLKVADYSFYTRTVWESGLISENGTGMEWGIETYLIPDFTSEESILFLKKSLIDCTFGEQKWIKSDSEIVMTETDGVSWRRLKITKCGEYKLIEITEGM